MTSTDAFNTQGNATAVTDPHTGETRYNRVPQVTWDFWLVKLLAVTVGETAADLINTSLGLGLTNTSLLMSVFLIVALVFQFAQKRYVPVYYWTTVVLVSVVGTLITDNFIDNLGWSFTPVTLSFTAALAATFAVWYMVEKTLSIHSIYTFRREAFYWLAILFTFALGTSAGDQLAEGLGVGFLMSGLMYAAVIAVIAGLFYGGLMNGILAFWLAYIITRPMGASFGDYLSQPVANGGLGLGTIVTSLIFFAAIGATVWYMTRSKDGLEVAQD
ncbi:COG4705 family protein [Brevirhabdus sp.]|uniref:COG4705 family protein n=1 Tax=Brevirhabdus sp. TaxID=2004514 RepID=UPI0040598D5A